MMEIARIEVRRFRFQVINSKDGGSHGQAISVQDTDVECGFGVGDDGHGGRRGADGGRPGSGRAGVCDEVCRNLSFAAPAFSYSGQRSGGVGGVSFCERSQSVRSTLPGDDARR
ncbi:hypothetical protein SDC9_95954 [bioreactor metagenome]|uniref:Uncharacterized protein n=1 Tax=bioreactor metagenome TaxID=1076179 RepID=A0A645A8H8_9ZZZZ